MLSNPCTSQSRHCSCTNRRKAKLSKAQQLGIGRTFSGGEQGCSAEMAEDVVHCVHSSYLVVPGERPARRFFFVSAQRANKTAEGGASGGSQMDKTATSFLPMRGRLAPIVPNDAPYALTSPESGLICHRPGILGRLTAASREGFARLPTFEASLVPRLLASSTAPSRTDAAVRTPRGRRPQL